MSTIEKPRTYASSMPSMDTYTETPPQGIGWVMFSAIMLGFVGVWGIIDGILAISSSKIFTASATYVFSDLRTWGWIVLILGVLSVTAAFSLFTGSEFARWFGIGVASLSAMGQLLFVQANPWWSMAIFTVDVLIIYGLAVYAGSRLKME